MYPLRAAWASYEYVHQTVVTPLTASWCEVTRVGAAAPVTVVPVAD